MSPTFSVAIVTHNRVAMLMRALDSVYAQGRDDLEIVVVDNASSDETAESVRARYPQVTLIRLPRNLGCPDGRNHAYANCRGNYIVNLDDDGWLAADCLHELERVFDADPSIGIVAMRQCYPEAASGAGHAMSQQLADVGLFSGGVSTFRREMLNTIGAYPSDFFLYAEESFLAIRALDAGYRIVSAPHIIMWHPREGGSSTATWRDYHIFRNNLMVVLRLFPAALMWRYLLLRSGSYLLKSLRRGSFLRYCAAMASMLAALPGTLLTRRPASRRAVDIHLRRREPIRTASASAAISTARVEMVAAVRGRGPST